jgi:outer membrane protein assembly factor BamB
MSSRALTFGLARARACAWTLALPLCLAAACSGDDSSDKSSTKNAQATKETKDAGGSAADAGAPKHASWTMMGYDERNHYYQPDEHILTVDNAKDLKEQWRIKTPGFPTGTPVIVDGKVFLSATGGFLAVDLETGKELWTQPEVRGTATPAYRDGYLYMHASAGANLYKLDAKDGSIVWGPKATYPQNPVCDGTSSPIVAGDKVLVGHSCGSAEVTGGDAQAMARGGVEALSTEDGSPLWTYWTVPESGETGAMVWSTVGVDLKSGTVFATTGNNYTLVGSNSDAIHAIDLKAGTRKWVKQVREGDLWSINNRMVFGTGEDTDFGANPILAEVDGKSVVAAGDKGGAFWMVDRESGEIIWSRSDLSAAHSASNGGVLMNGGFDGKYFYVAVNEPPDRALMHVLDPKDGADVRTPTPLDGIVWGAPSMANGLLFVPVNSKLHVYKAVDGEELTSFETGGTIASGAAAVVDGHVIVKSGLQYGYGGASLKDNNEVICYGLGTPKQDESQGGDEGKAGAATFSAIYKEIIVAKSCSGSALCHAGEVGHLQMKDADSTYKALVYVKAMGENTTPSMGPDCKDSGLLRVAPSKPEESLLLLKLEGTQPCGEPMPIGAKLSDEQISQVRAWIQDGAKNN